MLQQHRNLVLSVGTNPASNLRWSWRGVSCQIECRGGTSNICSGHGKCDADGACVCVDGWRLTACDHECEGGTVVVSHRQRLRPVWREGVLESQEQDAPKCILWYKPLGFLGVIRPHRRLRIGLHTRSSNTGIRLKTSSRPLRSRVSLNSFGFTRSSASWPL